MNAYDSFIQAIRKEYPVPCEIEPTWYGCKVLDGNGEFMLDVEFDSDPGGEARVRY